MQLDNYHLYKNLFRLTLENVGSYSWVFTVPLVITRHFTNMLISNFFLKCIYSHFNVTHLRTFWNIIHIILTVNLLKVCGYDSDRILVQ